MSVAAQRREAASVWDGVYTAAQAERGRAVYEMRCSRCHGADLRGVSGSSLTGDAFMLHWEGRTVERLSRRIHDTMPPDGAGTMTGRETIDTVAYLLQRNGFPDGAIELAAEPAAAAAIEIKSRTGPPVVRNGALVQATGCLTRNDDDGWLLTDAAAPQVTTLDSEPVRTSNHVEAAKTGEVAPGSGTIGLVNAFPNPAAHNGHTMRAKGFLIRDAAGDRINVVTLEMVAPQCNW
jgi:S-disulfanyl-L-cysteine oxidoreductase SoxD